MEAQSERVTYINGRWVPESKACIHIYDSQFMFGDAVFEMHRTFNHQHFLFDEHIDRLFSSMRNFYIPTDMTRDQIKSVCDELMARNYSHFSNDEYRFMINVSRGPLAIYKEVFSLEMGDDWNKPTWIINAWPLSKTAKTLAHFYDSGVNAVVVPQRQIPAQFLDPKVKSRSRAHLQLANIQASKFGKDAAALLLDDQGLVTEGTGANFVIVKNKKIIVPELRNVLRGCSLIFLLKLASNLGIDVVEKNFECYDVLDADEAMFTGTFTNLIPCNRLNGQFIKGREDGSIMGPITKLLCDEWSNTVGVDFIKQVKEWSKSQ